MPMSPLRPCSYPGCTRLVQSGRCAEHQVKRDAETHRLYGRRWQARAKAYIASHPWCEDCLERGEYVPAVDVHHMTAHRGDPLTFVTSDLMALCKACHTVRTNIENNRVQVHGEGGSKSFNLGDVERVGLGCEKNSPIDATVGQNDADAAS